MTFYFYISISLINIETRIYQFHYVVVFLRMTLFRDRP